MMHFRIAALACGALLLAACSSMTTISSPNAGTTLVLPDRTLTLPQSTTLHGTSFGNYEFKAIDSNPDAQPFYGILPLAMKKGHMVADILLFAPGMFFNLRGAFRFYEVDAAGHSIRYRDRESEPWQSYQVKPEKAERARAYFEQQRGVLPSGLSEPRQAAAGAG